MTSLVVVVPLASNSIRNMEKWKKLLLALPEYVSSIL